MRLRFLVVLMLFGFQSLAHTDRWAPDTYYGGAVFECEECGERTDCPDDTEHAEDCEHHEDDDDSSGWVNGVYRYNEGDGPTTPSTEIGAGGWRDASGN